jgi:hypothetical protein|tara:strand:- start:1800 stop:1907 length:108 start_codon:yes stop_codon:yes gene_type:complete
MDYDKVKDIKIIKGLKSRDRIVEVNGEMKYNADKI